MEKSESLIGSVTLDLRELQKQEEYEITLDIIDDVDLNKINSSINTKIMFIWSYVQYYSDLKNKSNKLLESYNSILDKTDNLLNSLNGKRLLLIDPFKSMERLQSIEEMNKMQFSTLDKDSKNVLRQNVRNLKTPATDTTENFISNRQNNNANISKPKVENNSNDGPFNLNILKILRISFYILLLISMFNSVIHSEMINVRFELFKLTSVLLCILIVNTSKISKDPNNSLNYLIFLLISMASVDIIYFALTSGNSPLKGFYFNFMKIINFLAFFYKIVLIILVVIKK